MVWYYKPIVNLDCHQLIDVNCFFNQPTLDLFSVGGSRVEYLV